MNDLNNTNESGLNKCFVQTEQWRNKSMSLRKLYDLTSNDRREIIHQYLMQLDNESNNKFEYREKLAIFRPYLQQQVNSFIDKIFQMPAQIITKNKWLEEKAMGNFDGFGRNFAEFAKDFAKTAELVSQGYCLVDRAAATHDEFGNVVLNQEIKTSTIILDVRNILHTRVVDGDLKYIRFREKEIIQQQWEDLEVWSVKEIFKVDDKVYFNKYQMTANNSWVQSVKDQQMDIDHIPLIDVYPAGYKERFETEAVWLGLADDNIDHLQYNSQYLNLSKTLSAPLLYGRNMGINNNVIKSGSGKIIHSENYDSDLKYVEPTGNSLEGSKKTVEKIENDIDNFPLNINKSSAGGETATKSIIQEGAIIAVLSAHAQAYKSALNKIVKEMLIWEGQEGIEFEINVNVDFTIRADALQLQVYNDLKDRNVISDYSYVEGVKYAGYLPENFNTKKDFELIKEEMADKLPATLPIPNEEDVPDFNMNGDVKADDVNVTKTEKQMDTLFNKEQ